MFYLVSYDIPDTPRRTKISKTLKDFGERVQYSVFECLLDQVLLDKMVYRLEKIIEKEEDSIRIYGLCGNCEKAVKVMGLGVVTKDDKYFIL